MERATPRSRWRGLVGIAVVLAVACTPTTSQEAPADLVLVNGKIVTVDEAFAVKQAVAIRGGTIVAVGTDADARRFAGAGTRVIDLGGRTMLPGLIDSHTHAIRAGLT